MTLLKDHFNSTDAPASFSSLAIFSASSLETASFTVFGAPSTRSLASFKPRPVIARTALITLILLSPPYITTNTEDDRVHPGHPRKFAAELEALGLPYLYYENTFGGHANDADPELNARRWARHYVYLAQKLAD